MKIGEVFLQQVNTLLCFLISSKLDGHIARQNGTSWQFNLGWDPPDWGPRGGRVKLQVEQSPRKDTGITDHWL